MPSFWSIKPDEMAREAIGKVAKRLSRLKQRERGYKKQGKEVVIGPGRRLERVFSYENKGEKPI